MLRYLLTSFICIVCVISHLAHMIWFHPEIVFANSHSVDYCNLLLFCFWNNEAWNKFAYWSVWSVWETNLMHSNMWYKTCISHWLDSVSRHHFLLVMLLSTVAYYLWLPWPVIYIMFDDIIDIIVHVSFIMARWLVGGILPGGLLIPF